MMSAAGGSTDPDRWFGVGDSDASVSRTAGARAAAQALVGSDAALLIVFASAAYDHVELLRASASRPARVVVSAIGGAGFFVATAAAKDASVRLRDAGAEAASCLDTHDLLGSADASRIADRGSNEFIVQCR
jgi:hypothetical protein